MKILYVKNNSERAKEFQLKTVIFELNGQKFVKKQALCSEAIPHLKKMKESFEKLTASIINQKIKLAKIVDESEDSLTFEFIDGISLEKKFNETQNKNIIIDEYLTLVRSGFKTTSFDSTSMVTDTFINVFGNQDYSELDGELCFSGIANIDLIFSNIILKDDSIYLIDYEWVFNINVPIEYVVFRALHDENTLYQRMESNLLTR